MISDVTSARKVRPAFPDLLPFESTVFIPASSRAAVLFATCGAAGKNVLASLPRLEIIMLLAMMVLASA